MSRNIYSIHNYQITTTESARFSIMNLQICLARLPEIKRHNYICDLCLQEFLEISNLETHLLKHVTVLPLSSSVALSTDIDGHISPHMSVQPYLCNVCLCTFSKLTLLKAHKQDHKREEAIEDSSKLNRTGNCELNKKIHTILDSCTKRSFRSKNSHSQLDNRNKFLTDNISVDIPDNKSKRQPVSVRCQHSKKKKTFELKSPQSKIRKEISRSNKHIVQDSFSSRFSPIETEFIKSPQLRIMRISLNNLLYKKSGNKLKKNTKTRHDNLSSHVPFDLTVRLNKIHTCDLCSFVCVNYIQLATHIQKHTSVVHPYKCSVCEYSCSMNQSMRRHVAKHHSSEKKSDKLQQEMKHKNWKRLLCSCTTCGFSCDSLRILQSHVSNHVHKKDYCLQSTGLYQCVLCRFKCGDVDRLKKHLFNCNKTIGV